MRCEAFTMMQGGSLRRYLGRGGAGAAPLGGLQTTSRRGIPWPGGSQVHCGSVTCGWAVGWHGSKADAGGVVGVVGGGGSAAMLLPVLAAVALPPGTSGLRSFSPDLLGLSAA